MNLLGSGATFSPCNTYRYALWRYWKEDGETNYALFIGLNPSTADATQDDPTIRRCIGFARDWGLSGLVMVNLFAYRATNPEAMLAAADPIGSENDRYLLEYANKAKIVIAAWGNHGTHMGRHYAVQEMIPNMHCLTLTRLKLPGHPLYLSKDAKPIPYLQH